MATGVVQWGCGGLGLTHIMADEDDEIRMVNRVVDVVATADGRSPHVHPMPCHE